jgi:hypothetical protein
MQPLKFNTTTSNGLSSFLANLKRALVESNMDVRHLKHSKLLHRAADAFGLDNWTALANELDFRQYAGSGKEIDESKTREAQSTLADLLDLNRQVEAGEEIDLNDTLCSKAITSVALSFSLGSDRSITFDVGVFEGEFDMIHSALIEVRGFDTIGYSKPEGDELDALCALFESEIIHIINK